MRWIHAGLAVAGGVLGVLAYEVQMNNLPATTSLRSWAGVVAAWSFLLAGLIAWSRRPRNRLGPLMVLTCFALLARQFRYSHDELAFTAFFLLGEICWVLVGHVTLAYPFGRVTDRLEKAFLWVAYGVAIAFPLAILLVYDGSRRLRYVDPVPRDSLLLVSAHGDVVDALQFLFGVVAYGFLATVFVLLVIRKLAKATPRGRRVLLPILVAAVVAAAWSMLNGTLTFASAKPPSVTYDLFWWQFIALTALPLALLWGLLRARLARVHVGELVVQLESASVDTLRGELARALEDPTLEVGLWLPDRGIYVDASGVEFSVPEDSVDRAVTLIENDGEPL
ncbi:MAG TPA: hypothetical protein VFT33_03535, partial [Gaiellaceae bacterium]|nr:hypothetical protein [Gaiellaceae bacterium]